MRGTKTVSDILAKTMSEAAETAIDTWAGYRTAVLDIVGRAEATLVLFDPDLSQSGLESSAGIDSLLAFLHRSAHPGAIRILLRDATHLERNCPRLLDLLARFGHRIAIRTVGTGPSTPEAAFVIADRTHLLIRFHHTQARGKLLTDSPDATADRSAQFETLWIDAEIGPSGVILGL